jgi:hypothetical protein
MKSAIFTYTAGELCIQRRSDIVDFEEVQLVLCFGEKNSLKSQNAFAVLRQSFPKAAIAICSAAGAIVNSAIVNESFTAAAIQFSTTIVKSHAVNIADFSDSFEAGASLMKKIDVTETKYLFVLCDGQLVNGSELIRGINESNLFGIPVSGGLAADGYDFQSTLTGINSTPSQGNIVAMALCGDKIKVTHGTAAGWENFGPERCVTKSKGNRLLEIDGKNALDLYKKYLGKEAEELPGSALFFPLSLKLQNNEQPLIRTILSIDPVDNGMIFAGDIPEGAKVRFMRANLDKLTNAATSAAQQTMVNSLYIPKLAILVSCVGRKLVLKGRIDEELIAIDEIFEGKSQLTGFYSYGEIAPCLPPQQSQLHNQTMTITTFYETE